MKVRVRVYAGLRRYLPGVSLGESVVVDLPPEATVGDAVDRLGIPRAELKVCLVDGVGRGLDFRFRDGIADDHELAVFPPVAGGDSNASAG